MEEDNLNLKVAYEFYEKNDFNNALNVCNRLINKNKNNEKVISIINYYKGLISEEMEDTFSAIKFYDLAIASKGFVIESLIRKYEIYRRDNNFNNALKIIEEIIRLFPDDFFGYDLKFNFLFDLGVYDEAERVIDYLYNEFEISPIIIINKVKLYVMKRNFDEALKIIEVEKDNIYIKLDLLREKAKILAIKGEINESLEIYLNLKNEINGNVDIIHSLGVIYIFKGDFRSANKILSELLDLEDKENIKYLTGLYYYYVTLKSISVDESQKYLKQILRKYNLYSINDSNNLNILILRAICNYELKNYKEAIRIIDYVEDIAGNLAEVSLIKCLIYSDIGESDKYVLSKKSVKEKDLFIYGIIEKLEGVRK